MIRETAVGLVVSLGFLAVTVHAVRRRAIRDHLALLWLMVALVSVVFAATTPLRVPDRLAHLLGFRYGSDLLLLGAVVLLLLVCFSLSVAVARLGARTTALAQELGMLAVRTPGGHAPVPGDSPEPAMSQAAASPGH